ncbi:ABC transporter permease [Streptomyces sp. NPDC048254]|uniref:ABC transporter permease n=1 Tax=Streptomyces sp. NPDC048254 TaxID=3365525 RepID=UPI00371CDC90
MAPRSTTSSATPLPAPGRGPTRTARGRRPSPRNVYLGLRLRERELVEVVQVMGGRRHHVLGYVTIPTLAAPFFAALKTGGPLAILGVIGGEFIASSEGVGHQLFTSAQNLDAASEFAGLIILVAMTLVLNGALTALDTYALERLGLAARRTPRRDRGGAHPKNEKGLDAR